MENNVLRFSIYSLCICLIGCEKPKDMKNTFTLGSGVDVVLEKDKCESSEIEKPRLVKMNKEAYLLSLTDFFSCNAKEDIYLTLNTYRKASLVFYSEKNHGCECLKEIDVKISSKRLDSGDTLYIVNHSEVIDHLVVP